MKRPAGLPHSHAHARAIERYGLPATVNGRWLKGLLKTIREGGAKFVQLGQGEGRLIYDVPTDTEVYRGIVRLVVNVEKTFVISVVPPTNSVDRAKQRKKDYAEAQGKRTRDFYRSLRIEGNDDEDATGTD